MSFRILLQMIRFKIVDLIIASRDAISFIGKEDKINLHSNVTNKSE